MLKFGEEARETATFVKNMDHFFDCFNVSSFTAGKLKRKHFLAPYRSSRDFQFKVCYVCICMVFANFYLCNILCLVPGRTYMLLGPVEDFR